MKFNSNLGVIPNSVLEMNYDIANTFSHYTYERSKGNMMILDIQGVGTSWTDPQIVSLQQDFGKADLGRKGMDGFFANHKCGRLCRLFELTNRSKASGLAMPQLE